MVVVIYVSTSCLLTWCLLQAIIADFELSEGIYSHARVEEADSVCLWLGANVMLEYSCEEVLLV